MLFDSVVGGRYTLKDDTNPKGFASPRCDNKGENLSGMKDK